MCVCVCVRACAREDGKWKGVREERGTRVQRGEAGGREEPCVWGGGGVLGKMPE